MRSLLSHCGHLLRRTAESVRARQVPEADRRWVEVQLLPCEFELWASMQTMDKVHSIGVAQRLIERHPTVSRLEIASALLHDVGKSEARLGLMSRAAATLLGPRTRRWRLYLDHEAVGAEMCRSKSVDERICALIAGEGSAEALSRLRAADDL